MKICVLGNTTKEITQFLAMYVRLRGYEIIKSDAPCLLLVGHMKDMVYQKKIVDKKISAANHVIHSRLSENNGLFKKATNSRLRIAELFIYNGGGYFEQ
jgi:hypothetical protein